MAYQQTQVAPEKSQAGIKKLLMAHGGINVSFASATEPVRIEGFRATIYFEEKPYAIKIAVPVRQKKNEKLQDQEVRRVWRVLYHHLKSTFEAADSGVIDIRELLLPFLVTKDGRTVGQIILIDLPKTIEAPRKMLEAM